MSRPVKGCFSLGLLLLALCLSLGHDGSPLGGAPAPAPRNQKELTNSIGMKFVRVPAGKFLMGSPRGEKYHQDREEPYHQVEITRPFYLGVYEVTQAQYRKVTGDSPSFYSATGKAKEEVKGLNTDDFPVEMVSWEDAVRFCVKLAAQPAERRAGRSYRLPTEAEWEYACRAGTKTAFHYGNTLTCKDANFDDRDHDPGPAGRLGKRLDRPTAVGSYKPNAFGLFDMHGNVSEWCHDHSKRHYYKESPRKDPRGPSENDPGRVEACIFRGGSYYDAIWMCRSAYRLDEQPWQRRHNIGFRVVCKVP